MGLVGPVKLYDPGCYVAHKVPVVRDEHHRAFEALKGVGQHALRAHVEVVGRLVEYEQVGWMEEHLHQDQSAFLAAAEHPNLLEDIVPAKEKGTEHPPQMGDHVSRRITLRFFEHAALARERIRLLLREIGRLHAGTIAEGPAVLLVDARDDPQQGGFAGSVRSDHRHLFATLELHVDAGENGVSRIALFEIGQLHDDPTGSRRLWKRYVHGFEAFGDLDRLYLFELFYAALYQRCLGGVVPESIYERLEALDVGLLLFILLAQLLELALAFDLVFGEVSRIHVEGAHEQFRDVIGGFVEKIPVVRDQKVASAIAREKTHEPLAGFDVEIVGGLVEEE